MRDLDRESLTVPEAIRMLRAEYGNESQQAFATRLEMSIASIANYETGARTPDGASSIKLARAAVAKGLPEIQRVFDEIIRDAMGGLVAPIHTEDEYRKVRAVQSILFDPRFKHLREPLADLLAPVEALLWPRIEAYHDRVAGPPRRAFP